MFRFQSALNDKVAEEILPSKLKEILPKSQRGNRPEVKTVLSSPGGEPRSACLCAGNVPQPRAVKGAGKGVSQEGGGEWVGPL